MDIVTALNVTIYGLGIVFLALLVVMFAIMILSRLFAAVTGKDFMAATADSEEIPSKEARTFSQSSPASVRPIRTPAIAPVPTTPAPSATKLVTDAGKVNAPLPGNVLSIAVKTGDSVLKGDELCVIEAMKMANIIRSQRDCIIQEVLVSVGDIVPYGAPLFEIE